MAVPVQIQVACAGGMGLGGQDMRAGPHLRARQGLQMSVPACCRWGVKWARQIEAQAT